MFSIITENLKLKSVFGSPSVGSVGTPTSRTSPPLIQVHCMGEFPSLASEQGILADGRGQSNKDAVSVTVTPKKSRTGSIGAGNSSKASKTGSWRTA